MPQPVNTTTPKATETKTVTSRYAYPLGIKGDIIGTPGVGTHILGNWESDEAYDIAVPTGTPVIAVDDGTIGSQIGPLNSSSPTMEGERFHLETATDEFYYAHLSSLGVKAGQKVKKGQVCGQSGAANGVEHLHFARRNGDPKPVLEGALIEGATGGGAIGGPVEIGTTDSAEVAAISKGAALAAFVNLPGLAERIESQALKGERSLMNDTPLFPFIEQLCKGSLRNFMSMPDGNFFAFIPDYFGGLTGRQAYWEIDDIEILSGEINLSDDALATHVYVVGDTGTIDQAVDFHEKITTAGVITVFNGFMADFLNGVNDPTVGKEGKTKDMDAKTFARESAKVPSLAEKDKAIAFLEKYGARPYYEEAPYIRSHYFEMFLAYQIFCLMWSKQFLTTFELTFMPELFPGGLVKFPSHGIQCYIDEVSHEGSYETGFRTRAALSAPTALSNGNANVNEGMIRSGIFAPVRPAEEFEPAQGANTGNMGGR